MKIVTWNLERPKKANHLILDKLNEFDADILILTETNSAINLGRDYFFVATKSLEKGYDGVEYKQGENRTTIWSKYKINMQYMTCDSFTSVCAEIESEMGILNVYGTIIGVFGGHGERFRSDLENQLIDFENLSHKNSFCIAGDFNITFSGRAYPSHDARNKMNSIFEKLDLTNLTSNIENSADHIVLSREFLSDKKFNIEIWNEDKTLSDHIGICITLKYKGEPIGSPL